MATASIPASTRQHLAIKSAGGPLYVTNPEAIGHAPLMLAALEGQELETMQRLERRENPWRDSLTENLKSAGLRTFEDIRNAPKIELPRAYWERIVWRLSTAILCGCGQPYMLRRAHVTCERPGCRAFHRLGHDPQFLNRLKAAFPDQIQTVKNEDW